MNYFKHYTQLILKAQARGSIEGYTELHHIIPKSVGGSDASSNLVRLTAKEHFVAHLMLAKMYGGKLIYAAWAMANQKNKFQDRSYRITSSSYNLLKESCAANTGVRLKKANTGKKQSDEHKQSRLKALSEYLCSDRAAKQLEDASKRMKTNNPNKGGISHPNADQKVYRFVNTKTSEVVECKRVEFALYTKLSNGKIEGIMKGRTSREGWQLG